jgi:hypothetical protein
MNFIIKHTGKISTCIITSKNHYTYVKREITPTAERIVDYTYKISSEVMVGGKEYWMAFLEYKPRTTTK